MGLWLDGSSAFPTPHGNTGEGSPREAKCLRRRWKSCSAEVLVEKLDGANLGLSLDRRRPARAQNRGQYLADHAGHSRACPPGWRNMTGASCRTQPELILFGEWCAACTRWTMPGCGLVSLF
jgi:hypothetical protein